MSIVINGSTEQAITELVAAGYFVSAEQAVQALLQNWLAQHPLTTPNIPSISPMIDIHDLIQGQGTQPFDADQYAKSPIPPDEEEKISNINLWLREIRN